MNRPWLVVMVVASGVAGCTGQRCDDPSWRAPGETGVVMAASNAKGSVFLVRPSQSDAGPQVLALDSAGRVLYDDSGLDRQARPVSVASDAFDDLLVLWDSGALDHYSAASGMRDWSLGVPATKAGVGADGTFALATRIHDLGMDSSFIELHSPDGTQQWTQDLGDVAVTALTLSEDEVVVQLGTALRRLDRATGALLAEADLRFPSYSEQQLDGQSLALGWTMSAIDPADVAINMIGTDGVLRWQTAFALVGPVSRFSDADGQEIVRDPAVAGIAKMSSDEVAVVVQHEQTLDVIRVDAHGVRSEREIVGCGPPAFVPGMANMLVSANDTGFVLASPAIPGGLGGFAW